MSQKLTILAVDDNPLNLDILVDLLKEYEVLVSLNAKNGLELLKEYDVDLILLDIMMPQMNGIEMAHILKSQINTQNIPILFLSANSDEESIEDGLDAGAVDYVIKPFRPKELLARVKTHLKMSAMYKEIHQLAYFDYLSGARNRRSFFEHAQHYIKDSSYGNLYAVMIDIDKFKNINDKYGHAIGDLVIKSLSQSINEDIEDNMLFARLGGEEFAILIKSSDKEGVGDFVESLRAKIENSEVKSGNIEINYHISCGISCYEKDVDGIDALMDRADQALYEAKNTGRNKIKFRN